MPPRKGILKSGNAGNSSKASKAQTLASGSQEEKKLLFPPGYKYPLTILNERCQNNGWEKADVQTYQGTDGWTFAVTLCKFNKRTGEQEKVRMAPRPVYTRPSAIEARHWGATYALYRFCNGINLHLVLPPGPRDYWNILAAEHKAAPLHLQWMYAADPFAAKKEIEEKQKARSTVKLGRQRDDLAGLGNVPEVKMATTIREAVEAVIKTGLSVYPEAKGENLSKLSDEDARNVPKQLEKLGFSQAQIQNAMKFLTQSSAMTTNLLAVSAPLEAAIEYLVLHIPECDLPQRFLPSKNSSNPFITSLHSGSDDLKRRWIEEKVTKEAGWPINVVKEHMSDVRFSNDEASLIVALGKRLIGDRDESESLASSTLPYVIEHTEVEAYGATFITKSELVMPLFSAPITVHVLVSTESQLAYPRPGFIPLYLSSETIPAYVRLHLLSRLLRGAKHDTFMDTGEGFCLAVMRLLEDEWEKLEREGRPDISSVLQHLLPYHDANSINLSGPDVQTQLVGEARSRWAHLADKRSSIQVRHEFVALGQKDEYAALLSIRQRLPAFKFKDAFLAELASHRVVVVIGETGCGKTTQLPQFILDSLILSGRGSDASIIVTQPRRLAAISVAKRVSAERLDDGSVGYAVRGESQVTSKTKLLFCTTGVALRRVASGDQFYNVSHIVVDEVHERSVDNDVLLLALKEILRSNRNLRVVLMSATINYEKFSEYFNNAPVLEIPGFSYPVTDYFLEDIEPFLRPRNEHRAPEPNTLNREQNAKDNKLGRRNNRNYIDYQLIADVVQHIVTSGDKRGGILVFLSGVQEIRRCINAIRGTVNESHADIFPLHANLTNDEQSIIFKQTKKWKIIAATNVAETSITIDDVVYVVDTGKVKEMKHDPDLHLSKLEEGWISRAAGRQRRGRAGRTCSGKCYKLYTREEENSMQDFSTPEIHRLPLENIVLYVKNMYEKEDAKALLARAIDPPRDAAFDIAWSTLVDLGAVKPSGSMTPLGRYIAELPADVKLAKMLILGTIFRCLNPILTIVACLSSKPLFVSSMDKREEANHARARFSIAGSDLLTDVNAYDQCMGLRAKGEAPPTISKFCEQNFMSPSTVQSITSLRNDFFSYLTDLGFVPRALQPSSDVLNTNSDDMNLVKSVILGGLWPHVARVRVRPGAQKFDQIQAGTVAREIKARDYILYDTKDGRVFIHPGSILFDCASWKCDFITYSHKYQTDKIYLKGATQVSLYALLLLGGQVTVNHVMGGLNVTSSGNAIKLKAWPRIGILVNQLRRLLDAQLASCLEHTIALSDISNRSVLDAFRLLVTQDGMSEKN